MCLILLSYKQHSQYKLILATNRDEFYARPTLAMHWWKDKDGVLAGRDQKKKGTWMGIHKSGRFAAITNYRQMPITGNYSSSRGLLVSEFISTNISEKEYMAQLVDDAAMYDGYNLIFGDVDHLNYFSNRGAEPLELNPGIYGLSNHLLDTPWPKVVAGKERLKERSSQDEIDIDSLFEMMMNTDFGADSDLPDTGVGLELERILSAAFIDPIVIGSPEYGTRCSTVLLVDWDNNVTCEERSYVPEGKAKFNFTLT